MSSLSNTLLQAAQQNNELLSILHQTDYAPSSLKQNASYIADLKSQISSADKELATLHQITEDERKDHVKYRDSNVKRYLYKMGGSKGKDKFASKSEKEEKEFMDAWQKERSTNESRNELQSALDNAERDAMDLNAQTARHDKAQSDLDALYNSIFSGPTPEIPQEDQMEQTVQQNKQQYESWVQQDGMEKKAMEALSEAQKAMNGASSSIQDARRRSGRDMLGGGTFTDMMERDALAQAQNYVHGAFRHMDAARRFQPQIREMNEITIDQGHFFSDVMFDNIFSDMEQHERIKNSQQQIMAAAQHIHAQLGEQNERLKNVDMQVKQAGNDLEAARKELQRIRAEAFEQLAGSRGAGGAPPPQYQTV